MLGTGEIAALLMDISGGKEISRTGELTRAPPAQCHFQGWNKLAFVFAEVDFVMRCADLHEDDGGIDRDEIKPAILVWNALRQQQDAASARYGKENKGFEGRIDTAEIEDLLQLHKRIQHNVILR